MPILQPYIGGQNYRMTQERRDPMAGVNRLLGQAEQINLADRKNRIDDATIKTKEQLALRQAKFLKDPLADNGTYQEDMGSIVESNSESLEDNVDRHAFSRDMGLTTTLLGIEATGARTSAISTRGKENFYTKLKEQQSLPAPLRVNSIEDSAKDAVSFGFIDQPTADKMISGANINNAISDAKDVESAKRVMDIVSDEKFDNSIYKLTNDQRKAVYSQAKDLHDMYVVGDEFDTLSKDDEYAHKVGLIMGSDAPQSVKSTKIYDLSIMMGMSETKQGMAQAQLASSIGISPTGTKENSNALFMKIERMKLESPQDSVEAMDFLKRQRETLDEILLAKKEGRIGHPELLKLTYKFNKDLTKSKALAMGQVQETDDTPIDWTFWNKDEGYSYEDAHGEFSKDISNTSLRADYFNRYTEIVERMEDTEKYPSYVDKDKDKWGKRRDVRDQLMGQYKENKPKRAQETLDGAKRSVANTEMRRYSDKQKAWMVYDGNGWVKE